MTPWSHPSFSFLAIGGEKGVLEAGCCFGCSLAMGAQGDVLVPLQMQLALVRGHVPSGHGPFGAIRSGVAYDGMDPMS